MVNRAFLLGIKELGNTATPSRRHPIPDVIHSFMHLKDTDWDNLGPWRPNYGCCARYTARPPRRLRHSWHWWDSPWRRAAEMQRHRSVQRPAVCTAGSLPGLSHRHSDGWKYHFFLSEGTQSRSDFISLFIRPALDSTSYLTEMGI